MTKFIVSLFLFLSVSSVQAFDPKLKPIQVVIPFTPGGGVDMTFRHIQKYASQRGIVMVPIYKPGAEGLIGMSELATLPNDGYHVSVNTATVIAYYRMRNPSTDVSIITGISQGVLTVVVNPKVGINTLSDLENALKVGRKLNIGYGAPTQRMFIEQLQDLTHAQPGSILVPYKGGGPVLNDLVSGHIDMAVLPASVVKAQIESGKLIPITNNIAIKERFTKWESFESYAFIVEKDTNDDAKRFWIDFFKQYLNDTQVKKEINNENAIPYNFGSKEVDRAILANIKRMK
jgi:tripartite-type tricarboxylate transporter receptor subunit TctC